MKYQSIFNQEHDYSISHEPDWLLSNITITVTFSQMMVYFSQVTAFSLYFPKPILLRIYFTRMSCFSYFTKALWVFSAKIQFIESYTM